VGKWIALIVIVVIPLLVMSDYGRRWLFETPRSIAVWVAVGMAAVAGAVAWLARFPQPITPGKAVLVAVPLVQAVSFVVADRIFKLLLNRTPLPFDEARFGRLPYGGRQWPDIVFWLVIFFSLMIEGVFISAWFDVEFPSRDGAS
jgi:hypothetical protein